MVVFWVLMGLSGNFTIRARKYRSDDKHSTVRLADTDYLEACDSILQIGDILSRNEVKEEFHS